jgi:hypothetical protein
VAATKAERARQLIEIAQAARGLVPFRCQNLECGRIILEYEAPVRYILVRCRRCHLYSVLQDDATPA